MLKTRIPWRDLLLFLWVFVVFAAVGLVLFWGLEFYPYVSRGCGYFVADWKLFIATMLLPISVLLSVTAAGYIDTYRQLKSIASRMATNELVVGVVMAVVGVLSFAVILFSC